MRQLFLPFLLFLFQNIFSESYFPSAKYTIYEGLSGSEITAILISPDDFLWISTTNGLNRFDGYSFRNYNTDPADTNSLPNDRINCIHYDRAGNIYGITSNIIFVINKRTGGISYLQPHNEIERKNGLHNIYDFVMDDSIVYVIGENYFGTVDIKKQQSSNFFKDSKYKDYLSYHLNTICKLKYPHSLILGSADRIFLYNTIHSGFIPQAESLSIEFKKDNGIYGIIPGMGNNYYVFTRKRIWEIEVNSGQNRLIYESNNGDSRNLIIKVSLDIHGYLQILNQNSILEIDPVKSNVVKRIEFDLGIDQKCDLTSFVIDSAGILWIGSDKGLFKFIPHKNVFRSFLKNDIKSIQGSDGFLKAGFINENSGLIIMQSGTIYRFNNVLKGRIDDISNFKKIDSKINSITNSNGSFLISTDNGLYILRDFHINRNKFNTDERQFTGNKILAACFDLKDTIWFTTQSSVYKTAVGSKSPVEILTLSGKIDNVMVNSLTCNDNYLWIQGEQQILEYNRKTGGISRISFTEHHSPSIHAILVLKRNQLYIGTSDGLYEYSADDKKLKSIDKAYKLNGVCIYGMLEAGANKVWVSTDRGIIFYDPTTGKERLYDISDGLNYERFSKQFSSFSNTGIVLFGGNDGIILFHPDSITINKHIPNVEITQITVFNNKGNKTVLRDFGDTLVIRYLKDHARINFAVLDFWAPQKNNFLYSLVKSGEAYNWQNINDQNFTDITSLKPGYYTLAIKGMNNDGYWNVNSKEIVIKITQPFWRSKVADLIYILLLAGLFYLSVIFRTKHFRNLNRKFKEREHISRQIQLQKDELTIKNKNITDSLYYAKRIQMAMMPPQKLFKKLFNDSFILHISKDIVSGDFYWVNEVEGRIYFAAVDCTGHGVPGAFMSIIGFELLRRITETDKKRQPAIILDSLSQGFEKIFRDIENFTLRDGMDVAFCAIDKDMKVLEFAGAFNPLYLIRDNTITEIKGDRFSVGLNVEGVENQFKNNVIQLKKGDIIYIFTDGFADQFGGPEGKKYKYRRFRHLLLALHQLPMERQEEFLKRSINDWRGNLDQVDDILVMGIRIN